jgi:hypothetical protein
MISSARAWESFGPSFGPAAVAAGAAAPRAGFVVGAAAAGASVVVGAGVPPQPTVKAMARSAIGENQVFMGEALFWR